MKNHSNRFKQQLLALAISVQAGAVFAQAATSTKTLEEVEVIGTRWQNMQAIDARRTSPRVIDAVSADDAGRLPDFNIGEALQRLPGIGIQNDQAEARFVTVRALNAEYNYTTVDGLSIAVPDRNGRRVFMDVLPASLANRIDAIKTLTPDLEAGAIGGIIDIRTADAFDYDPDTLDINAELGKYDNDDGFRNVGNSGNGNVFYATQFGEDEQWGLVLTANYYKRDSAIPQNEWGSSRYFYDKNGSDAGQPNDPPYPGTGYAVPGERRAFYYHNDRSRYGGTAKIQFKPSDKQEYFVRAFWNRADDDEARQTDLLRHSGKGQLSKQTANSGTVLSANGLQQRHYLGQFDFQRSVWAISGGGNFVFDQDSELDIKLNYSGSSFDNEENWAEWRMSGDNNGDGIDDNAFSYQRAGDVYQVSLLDPEANRDFSQFGANRRQFDSRALDEDLYEVKVDWSANINEQWSYKTGLSFRQIDRQFNEDRDKYKPASGNDYTLANSGVVNNDVCLTAPGYTAGQCIVILDPDKVSDNWNAHYAANPDQWTYDAMTRDDNRFDYELTEEVFAAYAMASYNTDNSNLSFGLRYEDTSLDASGRRNVSGTGWTNTNNSGGYSELLPSINFSYNLNEEMAFRAAFTQSIGRPAFNLIAPVGEDLDLNDLELSRSNPDLKPRRSNNYDLGFDWYIDDGEGIIGINLFHKVVQDEIYKASQDETVVVDGQSYLVSATKPINSNEDTNIYGVELQLVKSLDSVYEGLGLSMNATLLKTDFTTVMNDGTHHQLDSMVGQPNESYNLALYYDSDSFSAKLAYNYQSMKATHRLRTDREYRNRYDTEEKSLDLKVSYRFNDSWSASFNALNLTDEGRGEVLGFNQELPIVKSDFGRALFLGVSYSL